jgi:hypothetical protein
MRASNAALPTINLKISYRKQPSQRHENFAMMPPSELQTAQTLSIFPQLHTPNSPPPFTLPSSPLKALPCFQPTFTRRTSGHCQGIFRKVNFVSPWNNNNNNNNNNSRQKSY